MTTPPTLGTLSKEWRSKAKAMTSGSSHGATRDYEDSLCADEIRECADDLDAACTALRDQLAQVEQLRQEMQAATADGAVIGRQQALKWLDAFYRLAASLTPQKEQDHTREDGQG